MVVGGLFLNGTPRFGVLAWAVQLFFVRTHNINEAAQEFNNMLSRVRATCEWNFSRLKSKIQLLGQGRLQIHLNPVDQIVVLGVHLPVNTYFENFDEIDQLIKLIN